MARFLVTTPGASATRWLTFALASHDDVFAAHGKFALDSVSTDGIASEHKQGDHKSLTRGNELADFYAGRTLDEVFREYERVAPEAVARGAVHTFTIGELLQREESGESLEGIAIANLVRHPVSFIESHTALVMSAEEQPDLCAHYRKHFYAALEMCPEVLMVQTDAPIEAMAFVSSCYSALQAANDLEARRWPNVRMEDVTTNVDALAELCESITGLTYDRDKLAGLVRGGAINSHRAKKKTANPAEVWRNWPAWKRDVFALIADQRLFDLWAEAGYDVAADVDHLRDPACDTPSPASCLGDFVEDYGIRKGLPPADLVDEDFCGFHLFESDEQGIAIASSREVVDCRDVDLRTLAAWQREGDCIIAPSVEVIRNVLQSRPPELADSLHGYNIVKWRGRFAAVAQRLGAVDLTALGEAEQREFESDGSLLWASTLDEARERVEQVHRETLAAESGPVLLESRNGFNIVDMHGRYAAVSQVIGAVDLNDPIELQSKQLATGGMVLWGNTRENVQKLVEWIDILQKRMNPVRFIESRKHYNIVEYRERYAALAKAAGEVDLMTMTAEEEEQLVGARKLLWETSLRAIRQLADQTRPDEEVPGSIEPPPVFLDSLNGFNLIEFRGRFLALSQSAGPVDIAELTDGDAERLADDGLLMWDDSLRQLQRRVRQATRQPASAWYASIGRKAKRIHRIPFRMAAIGRRVLRRTKNANDDAIVTATRDEDR